MIKWHAHVVHMAEHTNMVGNLAPPLKSGADVSTVHSESFLNLLIKQPENDSLLVPFIFCSFLYEL